MSIHTLFKALFDSNTKTITRESSAEIAFSNWKKNYDILNTNNTYLTDLYIKIHEIPRTEKKALYDTYTVDKSELLSNYYKTRKSEYLNKINTMGLPEQLFVPDTKIYTKYYLPSTSSS